MPTNTFTSPRIIAGMTRTVSSPWSRGEVMPQALSRRAEPGLIRPVVDAAGAVALDVRVPADRARAGPLAADVAPQQEAR